MEPSLFFTNSLVVHNVFLWAKNTHYHDNAPEEERSAINRGMLISFLVPFGGSLVGYFSWQQYVSIRESMSPWRRFAIGGVMVLSTYNIAKFVGDAYVVKSFLQLGEKSPISNKTFLELQNYAPKAGILRQFLRPPEVVIQSLTEAEKKSDPIALPPHLQQQRTEPSEKIVYTPKNADGPLEGRDSFEVRKKLIEEAIKANK